MEEKGFIFSGISSDGCLIEIVELKDYLWFLVL